MSIAHEAEKLWHAINPLDSELARKVLISNKEGAKDICHYEVHTLVLGRNLESRDAFSCLHYAAKWGCHQILTDMFKKVQGVNHNHASSLLGWTPLHYAVSYGHIQSCNVLLANKAGINMAAKDGKTPLHVAMAKGNRKMVVYLIKHGANLNIQDVQGNTLLHMCLAPNILQDLKWTEQDRYEMVHYLLSKGALFGIPNAIGDTAIHVAIKGEVSLKTLHVLLDIPDCGKALSRVNHVGHTPLHLSHSKTTTVVLVQNGSPLGIHAADGRTPLHVHCCNPDVINVLLNAGASANSLDLQWRTPLHVSLSLQMPNLKAISLLVGAMDNVDAIDKSANTPLHLACDNNYTEFNDNLGTYGRSVGATVVDLLLSKGVLVNVVNHKNRTPIWNALRKKFHDIACMLLNANADPDIPSDDGKTTRDLDPKWYSKNVGSAKVSQSSLDRPVVSMCCSFKGEITQPIKKRYHNEVTIQSWVGTAGNAKKADKMLPAKTEYDRDVTNNTTTDNTCLTGDSQQPEVLHRQLSLLRDEVKDMKDFLEDLSDDTDISEVILTPASVDSVKKEMNSAREDVKGVRRLLLSVSEDSRA